MPLSPYFAALQATVSMQEHEKCWAHSKGCSMDRHVVMFPDRNSASVGGDHGCQVRGEDDLDGLCVEHYAEIFGGD